MKVNEEKPVRMDFKQGYEEETFLNRLQVAPQDVEFLADNCTKVFTLFEVANFAIH